MLHVFIQLTRFVLFIERMWVAFALPLVLLFGLVASAAFGIWAVLPFWLHVVVLLAWLAICGVLFYQFRGQFPGVPSSEEGRVALERRHLLKHRPLTLAADKPAQNTSPEAQALFEKAQQQAALEGRKAGPTALRTQKLKTDKWALRYPVFILMLIAVWADSGRGFTELQQTFYPFGKQDYLKTIQGVDAWVYPPEYTQEARFNLKPEGQHKVVEGAEISVRLHVIEPLSRTPTITLNAQKKELIRQGQTYKARLKLEEGGALAVHYRGRTLFKTSFDIVKDTPPQISLNPPLEKTPEGMLNIPFTVEDDYGVKAVHVILSREINQEQRTASQELVIPKEGIRQAKTSSYVDFTADPFAGLTVDIRLKATDMAGQETLTEPRQLKLPERPFHHPVAIKLVKLRKTLFSDAQKAGAVRQALRKIMDAPEDFDDNSRAYLSITFAEKTLHAQNPEYINRATGLMWDAALHIEKGPLAIQMERLLNAQRELQKALAEGASPEKLDALFRKMAQAMSDLLQQAQFGNKMGEMMDVPSLQNSDLADLMKQIQELLQSGAHAEAQKKLKELEKLMAHVSMEGNQQMQQFMQSLSDLQEIRKQQQQLIEEAFENEIPGRLTPEQQLRQQMMASKLEKTAQKLKAMGMDTTALEGAAKAMRGAHQLSMQSGMEAYVNHLQNQAMQLMAQGQQHMAKKLRQQLGFGALAGMRRDPSGKLQPMQDGEAVLPDKAPESLSREIRDMLFDRAGQLKDSDVEHLYLQRLLEQF